MENNMKKNNLDRIVTNKFFFFLIFLIFLVLGMRVGYLTLVNFKVGNTSIAEFIKNRNTSEEILYPKRGTIYDKDGNVLAQDVSSYTVIAYLSPTRSENSEVPLHVVDKEKTAEALAPLINMTKDEILNLLNKENLYQVELGPGGRNLSQLEMEEIKNLNLPGIDFIKSTKRYYPKGDFASYTIGYTVKKENDDKKDVITGEMGIEGYYNDILTGENGYLRFEQDKYGYKIANGNEYIKEAVQGDDVYLTLDTNIQLFIENAVHRAQETSEAEWVSITIMNGKTGEILGTASTPSFDPNIRNMTFYLNPLVSYSYEPGSTMKVFTYMCAIDSGKYDGNTLYNSGVKEYKDYSDETKITKISDWNKVGWGKISYDLGFALSSNTAVADIMETTITKEELSLCFQKYGFGKKTNITLGNELKGNIEFNYPVEVANAAFGQGILTTPIQHLQALTAIANNGTMIKPYIVSKIVSDANKIVYSGNREVINKIANENTISKLKELMHDVINNDPEHGVGYMYKVDDYNIIGKTGTAQVFDHQNGRYFDNPNLIYSFSGLFPEEDPEIIVYAAMKHPKTGSANYLANSVKELISNVGNYLGLSGSVNTNKASTYKIGSYLNLNTNEVKSLLEENKLNVVVLGDGDKIIDQYPRMTTTLNEGDKVFLLTNNYNKMMPNLIGYSYKEVVNILELMGCAYTIEGNGYVYEQSLSEGTIVNEEELVIKLKL